jgi:hypothetical protein
MVTMNCYYRPESDNPEQAEIHNFLMLDIERRVYDLSRINDRLQAIN